MDLLTDWRARCARTLAPVVVVLLAACGGGGGTGTDKDSGVNKTYLSVDISDADGDPAAKQRGIDAARQRHPDRIQESDDEDGHRPECNQRIDDRLEQSHVF